MIDAAQTLSRAADLIELRGWFSKSANMACKPDAPLCANLAIGEALRDLLGHPIMSSEHYMLLNGAQQRLISYLDLDLPYPRNSGDSFRGRAIVLWNDGPARTQAEVVTALREAARR
jgi:hypothetical protein